jgi:hypothetical protein
MRGSTYRRAQAALRLRNQDYKRIIEIAEPRCSPQTTRHIAKARGTVPVTNRAGEVGRCIPLLIWPIIDLAEDLIEVHHVIMSRLRPQSSRERTPAGGLLGVWFLYEMFLSEMGKRARAPLTSEEMRAQL